MTTDFFAQPILNSPYERPACHWELDKEGQPTHRVIEQRRPSKLLTPVPKAKSQGPRKKGQESLGFEREDGISNAAQQYDPTPIINEIRSHIEAWRALPNANQWQVTPETARLLQHWRHHPFHGVRPFFCQVEAVETAIWLAEVAPKQRTPGSLLHA